MEMENTLVSNTWITRRFPRCCVPICSVEAVELLVASLFSDEAPLAPPSTGLAGFLRFLLLLAGHDWTTAPLLVDPQGELSAADRAAATDAFSRSRERGEIFVCVLPCLVLWTLERCLTRLCG